MEAKEALPQGPPPENRGPPESRGPPRNFVISIKFSIRLLKAREEIKPNKVITKSELVKKYIEKKLKMYNEHHFFFIQRLYCNAARYTVNSSPLPSTERCP